MDVFVPLIFEIFSTPVLRGVTEFANKVLNPRYLNLQNFWELKDLVVTCFENCLMQLEENLVHSPEDELVSYTVFPVA